MENTFSCGLVRVGAGGEEPRWDEVARRMGFAQRLGLNAVFMSSFRDGRNGWVVPFICAEDTMGKFAKAAQTIRDTTPYEVVGIRRIDVSKADLETLQALCALVPEPAREVRTEDVAPTSRAARIDTVEEAFAGLVGMESQKELFTKLAVARARYGAEAVDSFHFVFDGPPGTGKTELASRVPALLDLLGITDGTGKYVKAGEAEMVAKYVGHTAPKVRRMVESACGGTLHIDEAYAIANAPHFGQEAIDALVEQLDAHRHDMVCIISGYTEEIDSLLDSNPGLRDRFSFRIGFPDYGVDELADIFESMAMRRGFEDVDRDALVSCVDELRRSRGFSNARTMRKLLDHAVVEAASSHEGATIRSGDLLRASKRVFTAAARRRAGF